MCLPGEILHAIAGWFGDPRFDPTTSVLWDFREAQLAVTIEELSRMYDLVRENVSAKRAGGRTAWVVSSGFVGSILRIVQGDGDWGSHWQVFFDLDDGLRWCLESAASDAGPQKSGPDEATRKQAGQHAGQHAGQTDEGA